MRNTCCFIPENAKQEAREIIDYLKYRLLPPVAKFDDEADCHDQVLIMRGCRSPAEWRVIYGNGSDPDGYTESCTRHVGEMLTDAPEHRIYALHGPNTLMP